MRPSLWLFLVLTVPLSSHALGGSPQVTSYLAEEPSVLVPSSSNAPLELKYDSQRLFQAMWGTPGEPEFYDHRREECLGRLSGWECLRSYIEKKNGTSVFDLSVMTELNARAARLWNRMLDCAHGEPNELIRAYEAQIYCGNAPIEGKAILAELKEFHGALGSMAQTTKLFDSHGLYALHGLHPLLVQAVIEEFFYENVDSVTWDCRPGAQANDFQGCTWMREAVSHAYEGSERGTAFFFHAEARASISSHQELPVYQRIRRILFYLQVLDVVPTTACSQWGLFPRSWAQAVQAVAQPGYGLFPYWYDKNRGIRLEQKVRSSCQNDEPGDHRVIRGMAERFARSAPLSLTIKE